MRPPELVFECDYGHDRREHRHRCRCCSKIIEPGMRVLMVRLSRKTWALHIDCADKVNCPEGWTWRDSFEAWANGRILAMGFKVEAHPMSKPGAVKVAA